MRQSGEVLICQPYLPEYRMPLFEALAVELGNRGVSLIVAHGVPRGEQARRADARETAPWARRVETTRLPLPGGAAITWKHVGRLARRADVIVCELATTELNTWRQLAVRSERVIVWGHGKSYVRRATKPEAALEAAMAKWAVHTMTYTESGRESLVSRGVAASKVTAVGNSTDTVGLRELRSRTGAKLGARLQKSLGLPLHTVLFVGGLDADKRLRFLLSAARLAAQIDPAFALVVAGSGADSSLVDAVAAEPWIRWLPRVDAETLAALSTVIDCVWMPGRIGLVAVDALALNLPILTTRFPFHAPEYDYLREGSDVFILPDSPLQFAEAALDLAAAWRVRPRTVGDRPIPNVRDVAARMADVVCLVRAESGSVGDGDGGRLDVRRRPRIGWLTNIPTPYRAPVFKELDRLSDLEVYYLARTEAPRHWISTLAGYEHYASARRLGGHGDLHIYALARGMANRIVKDVDVMVIGGWESPAAWQVLVACRRHQVAVCIFYESTQQSHRFSRGPVDWLRRRFFSMADTVLVPGESARSAVTAMGYPSDRIVEASNAVDVLRFREGAARERVGTAAVSYHRFLYVGQLIARKNPGMAIAAFAEVAEECDELVIVGEGPLDGDLREQARQLARPVSVEFTGYLDDVDLLKMLASCHTLVLPSEREVWGLVVNEALAAGLHVVVSDVAGVVPAVNGMRGVYLARPSVDGVAAAMMASRVAWRGPIDDPQILASSPRAFAVAARDAARLALRVRAARGSQGGHPFST
jgi:glycosyltransferase involved in cell wall biosynthesis